MTLADEILSEVPPGSNIRAFITRQTQELVCLPKPWPRYYQLLILPHWSNTVVMALSLNIILSSFQDSVFSLEIVLPREMQPSLVVLPWLVFSPNFWETIFSQYDSIWILSSGVLLAWSELQSRSFLDLWQEPLYLWIQAFHLTCTSGIDLLYSQDRFSEFMEKKKKKDWNQGWDLWPKTRQPVIGLDGSKTQVI